MRLMALVVVVALVGVVAAVVVAALQPSFSR